MAKVLPLSRLELNLLGSLARRKMRTASAQLNRWGNKGKVTTREDVRSRLGKSLEGSLQVFDALGGDDFGAFVELEDFDGDEAVVADFLQRGGDGFEIDFPKARTFQVLVVRMKVGEVRP